MPAVTIRNLPEKTHRALKLRATRNGRTTEAEIRTILEDVVRPENRVKIGSELAAFTQLLEDIEPDFGRDQSPTEPAQVE